AAGVGHLVVVLQVVDEGRRRQAARRRAAPLALVGVPLPLEEVAVFGARHEFLWRAAVIFVIGLAMAGEGHHGAVMEVVVPQRVEAAAAARRASAVRMCSGELSRTSCVASKRKPSK